MYLCEYEMLSAQLHPESCLKPCFCFYSHMQRVRGPWEHSTVSMMRVLPFVLLLWLSFLSALPLLFSPLLLPLCFLLFSFSAVLDCCLDNQSSTFTTRVILPYYNITTIVECKCSVWSYIPLMTLFQHCTPVLLLFSFISLLYCLLPKLFLLCILLFYIYCCRLKYTFIICSTGFVRGLPHYSL